MSEHIHAEGSRDARVAATAKTLSQWLYPDYDEDPQCAKELLEAGDAVLFSPAAMARVVNVTGLSLQTVSEVARELRNG